MAAKTTAPTTKKPNVAPHELAIACTINSFFTVISLMEFSADQFALPSGTAAVPLSADAKERLLWLAKFYQWRGDDPIISKIFFALLVPLPLLLVGMASGALQSLLRLRRASRVRHAADVVQAATLLFVILPTVIKTLIPAQEALLKDCSAAIYGASSKQSVEVKCVESASALWPLHAQMLGLNLLMFACDVAKYVGNRKEPVDESKDKAA